MLKHLRKTVFVTLSFLFLLAGNVEAANRFWVGGNDNWDGTAGTKWATTSGGAGGAAVPTSADDVFLDNGTGHGDVTIATTGASAKSITCTGYVGTLTFNNTLTVAGAVTFVSGMSIAGTSDLIVTTTATLTSGGKTLTGGMQFAGNNQTYTLSGGWIVNGLVQVNGTTAATLLSSTLSIGGGLTMTVNLGTSSTTSVTLTGGTWSGAGIVRGAGVGSFSFTLAGNVTVSGSVFLQSATLTRSSGTITTTGSTVTMAAATTINTPGMSWANLVFNASVTYTLQAALSLTGDISFSGTTTPTFTGAFDISAATMTVAGNNTITLSGNLTASGACTFPNNPMTWVGAFTIHCGSVTNTSISTTRIYTFAVGSTWIVDTAFSTVGGTAANRLTWKTGTGGQTATFQLGQSATQDVGFLDPTDLDASSGQPIFSYAGSASNANNWKTTIATFKNAVTRGFIIGG